VVGARNTLRSSFTVVAQRTAHPATIRRGFRHGIPAKPAAPFLAVDDKTRSVNRVAAPSHGITLLSRCEFWFGEAIAPAEMVPVINVEGDGNNLLPQFLVRFECAQPFFGRRTTATPFRSEQFDKRVLRLTALKYGSRHR